MLLNSLDQSFVQTVKYLFTKIIILHTWNNKTHLLVLRCNLIAYFEMKIPELSARVFLEIIQLTKVNETKNESDWGSRCPHQSKIGHLTLIGGGRGADSGIRFPMMSKLF